MGRILGMKGVMTNDVMITMTVGMTAAMIIGMITGMIAGMTAEMTVAMTGGTIAEMTGGMTIVSVMTAEMTAGMTVKGHRGHLGKKNQGLLKDPHLIMTTHSGIPNGKEWKCRKKLTHWKKEENISS